MNNWKQGEQLFRQRMEQGGYIVQDVSGNSEYWDKDIDFVITSPTSGLTRTFEVKWDSCINRTGNLYLEYTSAHSKGGKGWFQFCQADYLVYGDAIAQVFYIIPFGELKQKVKSLPLRWAQCGQDSTGYLLALKDIQELVKQL